MEKWRGTKAAEWTGFENRRPSRVRGFKSHPLRHFHEFFPWHALPASSTVAKLPALWRGGRVAECGSLLSC